MMKRAQKGGQTGINGEFYKGGKFLPTRKEFNKGRYVDPQLNKNRAKSLLTALEIPRTWSFTASDRGLMARSGGTLIGPVVLPEGLAYGIVEGLEGNANAQKLAYKALRSALAGIVG